MIFDILQENFNRLHLTTEVQIFSQKEGSTGVGRAPFLLAF